MLLPLSLVLLLMLSGKVNAQKACTGQHGPIIGCSSDSRHFPCGTSPQSMVEAMCPNGIGSHTLLSVHKGNRCGYHYFQINCSQPSRVLPPPASTSNVPKSFAATGRIYCMENGITPSFNIYTDSSAVGESCRAAQQSVEAYFAEKDRCRYSPAGTYPNRRWDGKIEWLRTTKC